MNPVFCRMCKSGSLYKYLDLGFQPPAVVLRHHRIDPLPAPHPSTTHDHVVRDTRVVSDDPTIRFLGDDDLVTGWVLLVDPLPLIRGSGLEVRAVLGEHLVEKVDDARAVASTVGTDVHIFDAGHGTRLPDGR